MRMPCPLVPLSEEEGRDAFFCVKICLTAHLTCRKMQAGKKYAIRYEGGRSESFRSSKLHFLLFERQQIRRSFRRTKKSSLKFYLSFSSSAAQGRDEQQRRVRAGAALVGVVAAAAPRPRPLHLLRRARQDVRNRLRRKRRHHGRPLRRPHPQACHARERDSLSVGTILWKVKFLSQKRSELGFTCPNLKISSPFL